MLFNSQHLFKFSWQVLCCHRTRSPGLSTKERANVSAKPSRGIFQHANEKQVISTQYGVCVTRQCRRLAGGKWLHCTTRGFYIMHSPRKNNPYFLLNLCDVEGFIEPIRVSMEMPARGCKHGWPFEFLLFVGSMKSNHVQSDRGNGFVLFPLVSFTASNFSATSDRASYSRCLFLDLVLCYLKWRLMRRELNFLSNLSEEVRFKSSAKDLQTFTSHGLSISG